MNNRKVLFVGCSLTADSGFVPTNQVKYHWPHLFCNHYGYAIQNAGIGGSSNEEIFHRTTEILCNNQFDLVIVMWSDALTRKWVYFSDNNVDDFTILNKGNTTGFMPNQYAAEQYAKLHYAHFNNNFINIKRWLLHIVSLEGLLKSKNQPYIFINGFNNHINDIIGKTMFDLTDELKNMLDFDNRPDEFIISKLSSLQTIAKQVDCNNWLNFIEFAFTDPFYFIDYADDNIHPGKESNKKFYLTLIEFYEKFKLL